MKKPLLRGKLHLFAEIFKTMKWAVNVLKKHRMALALYILLLIGGTAYCFYITTRVGNVVDLALADNFGQLARSGGLLLALYTSYIILTIICNRIAAFNYNAMYNDLELKVYRKIMDSSWEELTEYHSGDLITRLSTDIKVVAGNTGGLVPSIIEKLTVIGLGGIYIIILDYSMLLIAAFVAVIVVVSTRIFMGKVLSSQNRLKEIESEINSYNKETFNNIQAVKAFGLGNYFYGKMEKIENVRKKNDILANTYSLGSWAISYMAGILGGSAVIAWMFYRVHTGAISFGSLSVMTFLVLQAGNAAKALLGLIPTVMEYVASAERVKKLLSLNDEKNDVDEDEFRHFEAVGREDGVSIDISDMSFSYKNGYNVFNDVNLSVKPGEIAALVGPSGGGKTTMLRIILGIVAASKGTVQAASGDLITAFGKQTRGLITYVPQGNSMMAGTIRENLTMIKQDATDEEIEDVLETACMLDFIRQLPDGLDHKLGENGTGFSEGQNQRLSIARALLKDAPILLMDEATSALDVTTERKILGNIMKKNPKKTVLLTTHRPSVLTMCDRIYRIADKTVTVLNESEIQILMDEF
jgi:ABC-type multidrug transport system fused ATPase/permease subunit